MTNIYLVRHAEAEGNYYRRIQGHTNGDITSRGYKQIDALAERFRDIPFTGVYASDLRRTQKTAQSVLKYHPQELHIDLRLKEQGMGTWEDKMWGNIAIDDPEQLNFFSIDPEKYSVEGCESYTQIQDRMEEIVLELAQKHEGETIALFSHGMAIRSFLARVLGIPSNEIKKIPHGDNTHVSHLIVENGKIAVDFYNDNSHLVGDLSTFNKQSWWKSTDTQKMDKGNLRLIPLNMEKDQELYCSCYRSAWQKAHGNLDKYEDEPYIISAKKASKTNESCLMKAFRGDDFAGLLELDMERTTVPNCGWISFIYLEEDLRRRGFGVQLLGHAVSFYRSLGRDCICLHVAETNVDAVEFYKHLGFEKIGETMGSSSILYLMKKSI